MKVRPMILFAAFTLVAACCSQNTAPETALAPVPDKFYVVIELVAFADQIARYPETWLQVQGVIAEWESKIPVKFSVYIEDPTIVNMFGYPSQIFHNRPYIQSVLLTDLQMPELGSMPRGIVGVWDSDGSRLMLDADTIEADPNLAFSVVLHEFGHMLGVPHIVNLEDRGLSGMVALPDEIDATGYVMYPQITEGAEQRVLSELEIDIAREYLIRNWTNPERRLVKKCELEKN